MLEATDLDRSEQFYGDVLGFDPCGRDLWPEEGTHTAFHAAIRRGQELVMPRGNVIVEEGDALVLVSRPNMVSAMLETLR